MTVARAWEHIKLGLLLVAVIYVWLMIEYDDNCTRYRAPWCGFLDYTVSWLPPEWR